MLVTPIATGSVTLQSLINVLGSFSSLGYTVFGYNDGAGMPDATTQADIDALIALGIPEARIAWVDLGTLNAFTIAGIASASSIENLVLSQAGGVFVIAAASSATDIENIVITSEGLSVFTIQDSGSASTIDLVVISQASGTFIASDITSLSDIENVTITSIGQFVVAAVTSASAIANVAMSQHGGTFAVADASSASGIDNVLLDGGASPLAFTENFSASLTNWTTITGSSDPVPSGGVVASGGAVWTAAPTTANQYAESKYAATNQDQNVKLYTRCSADASQRYQGQMVMVWDEDLQDWFTHFYIGKKTGGVESDLTTVQDDAGYTYMRLEANGTSITLKAKVNVGDGWTTILTTTDSSVSQVGKIGFQLAGSGLSIDDFAGGDL
jgi:hypothetical protein